MTDGGYTVDEAWSLQLRAKAERILHAGYDNGFGVTSLDTELCESMRLSERMDFALFLVGTMMADARSPTQTNAEGGKADGG
jgi:hypothetical protein